MGIRIATCADMCIGMRTDMHTDMWPSSVCRHVYQHVYRHACRHVVKSGSWLFFFRSRLMFERDPALCIQSLQQSFFYKLSITQPTPSLQGLSHGFSNELLCDVVVGTVFGFSEKSCLLCSAPSPIPLEARSPRCNGRVCLWTCATTCAGMCLRLYVRTRTNMHTTTCTDVCT